jgi:phosphatidate cytidylyltransferase
MMVLPRILTALVGIPLLLTSVYIGGALFLVVLATVVLYMLSEYVRMVNAAGYEVCGPVTVASGVLVFAGVAMETLRVSAGGTPAAVALTVVLLLFFLVEIVRRSPAGSLGRMGVGFAGAVLIGWSMAHLFLIRDLRPQGAALTVLLLGTVWVCDTGSYVFGSLWGRRTLARAISPKKSVLGAIAGVATGVPAMVVFWRAFRVETLSAGQAVLLGAVVSVMSIVSDLAESLIKRDCGFKDSDNLLPGHGGMLDRFDSFLFAAPVFYELVSLLANG